MKEETTIGQVTEEFESLKNVFADYKKEVAKIEILLEQTTAELSRSVQVNIDLKQALKNVYILLNANAERFQGVEELEALIGHLRKFFLNNIEVENASN